MAEDFLRRWSRLKQQQDKPVEKKEPALAPLPPVDKLSPDSDFAAFMQPKVEEALRRAALKKLFSDPRFNIPDPFEAYSGDWTGGEPISEELLATLNQARTLLFDKAEEKPKPQVPEEHVVEKPKDDEPGRQDA
jgi:Protein of unknown function (DUF3306)